MNLAKWQRPGLWALSPVRHVANLRNEVDNLFNLAFARLGTTTEPEQTSQFLEGWYPAVDITEDKDSLSVRAELPGMKKEDIEISLHEGFLTLSGERKGEEKREGSEMYRSERWFGRFHRSINLPYAVVADQIKATYHDGILTVTLPKAEEAKPKQIPITVK